MIQTPHLTYLSLVDLLLPELRMLLLYAPDPYTNACEYCSCLTLRPLLSLHSTSMISTLHFHSSCAEIKDTCLLLTTECVRLISTQIIEGFLGLSSLQLGLPI